ncbi:hypothetical protein [Columbia Basin potato purple top phytoplasma]|uniref:Uncharacterized protein n=1 Tax=Columbia Basin potato purple top phytoplasma TaxID=307134 RepID=A0ABT5L857_9MOLU|nr:hypothetical protein [Columbia Basin potato purple top phytoplasma]MDC9031859.1 hypothetical protein [Columbia Basin potato purple top phytoplasma]
MIEIQKNKKFFYKIYFVILILIVIIIYFFYTKKYKYLENNKNKINNSIEILENKKIKEEHKTITENLIKKSNPNDIICQDNIKDKLSPNNILIEYDDLNPGIIKIISRNSNKILEYNYIKGRINQIIDINENIKKYDPCTGHLSKEMNPDNSVIKEYNHSLNKEILPDGSIRNYFSDYFEEISFNPRIKKEYNLNSKRLTRIIFPNNHIKEYSLYNNKLTKEILPNGDIIEYDPFTGNKIKETNKEDGTIKEYNPNIGFILKEIKHNKEIIETKQEYNDEEKTKLKKVILPNKDIIEFEPDSNEIQQIIYSNGTIKKTIKEYIPNTQILVKKILPNNHIKEFDIITKNLTKEILPNKTIKIYDPINKLLIREIFLDNSYIMYEYNSKTNELLKSISSNGYIIKYDLNEY